MSKSFIISFLIWGVIGCTHQSINKQPPLIPFSQKNWVEVNAKDFVPPQAKTYVRIKEIDLSEIQTEPQEKGQE